MVWSSFPISTVVPIAKLLHAQQSTMGSKIWLSIHPRNFGCDKNVLKSTARHKSEVLNLKDTSYWNEFLTTRDFLIVDFLM